MTDDEFKETGKEYVNNILNYIFTVRMEFTRGQYISFCMSIFSNAAKMIFMEDEEFMNEGNKDWLISMVGTVYDMYLQEEKEKKEKKLND